MDNISFEQIRQELLRQRADILNEAEKAVEGGDLNVMPAEMADTVDRSAVETDRNFTLRLLDRDRKLLKKIDDALDRLEDDTFGACDECGEPIGLKRLLARPVATMCIACKEAQERQEKQS
ncbi:DksA family protein PA5536 (no Zn-finger) [hydrothermal vent metagenome]|uniref:DksA family protein PA5536 (No Zn-finger) n=1 Tax=hydrothermal vent metagenome TaxID=652676 RepID=A0A3B1BP71_9ZZZZ